MGWRRGWMVRLMAGLLGAGLVGGPAAASAQAGRYHAYSCHTPAGAYAPTQGWSSLTSGASFAIDDCGGATTYGLTAALVGGVAHPANTTAAVWAFTAPPDLALAGATLWRYEAVPGGVGPNSSYVTYLSAPTAAYDAADVFDNCQADTGCRVRGTNTAAFDPSNRLVVPAANIAGAQQLFMSAYCGGIDGRVCPPAPGYPAVAVLYAADLTLEDNLPPEAASVGGGLTGGGTLAGVQEIWFRAYDRGSGVYAATIAVDGRPISRQVIDDNTGRCKIVGLAGDGLPDFLYPTPCKTAVSADLTLDTGQLPDGRHALAVTVDDAAGNVAGVYSATITTHNAPGGGAAQVAGVLAQGQTLSVDPGRWFPAPTGYAYQWLRCDAGGSCQPIPGAVGPTYVPVAADDYRLLAVELTVSDAAGSTTSRTAPIGPIADPSGSTTGPGGGSIHAQSGGLAGARHPGSPGGAGSGAGGGGRGGGHMANGSGACPTARLTAAFRSGPVARVGLRGGATLHGALACAGRPVGAAAIEVSITRRGDRAGPAQTEVHTAHDGSFSLTLPPGTSRQLTLSYLAFSDAAAPAATASVRLDVSPSVALSVEPARARNGQSITYRGQVFGGHLPAGGLPLAVQYRDGRHWRTFDQTRARAPDGRFAYHYTFRRTTIPIVYTFRVAIAPGGVAGYPYSSAVSRPRSVRVTP